MDSNKTSGVFNAFLIVLLAVAMIVSISLVMHRDPPPDPILHYLTPPANLEVPYDSAKRQPTREVLLRKLHLVRPDLIFYPLACEVYA